jgi:hypothetical protein
VSKSYIPEDEQDGETLGGTKEMRAEGDTEDENISKRSNVPLTLNDTAERKTHNCTTTRKENSTST